MKDLHELFPRSKGFDGDYSVSVGVLDVSHSMLLLCYQCLCGPREFMVAVVFIHMHAPQSVSAVTLTVTWIKQNVS